MNTLKFILKTLIAMTIYIFCYGIIYSIIISKTISNLNIIATLIASSLGFGIISFCYANHFRKRCLIIGLLVSIIHILIIKTLYYFSSNQFNINFLEIGIQTLTGGICGILGGNIKKIF